jgi:hypothetical protein
MAFCEARAWKGATPEAPRGPGEEQGEQWKDDNADARTASTLPKAREESCHHEQANSIKDPERSDERCYTGENSTHAHSPVIPC